MNQILNNSKAIRVYPSRQINSIYFDTNNFKDFKNNFEGTVPRKKVRIRFYGNNYDIKNFFKLKNYYLEIKKTSYPQVKNLFTYHVILIKYVKLLIQVVILIQKDFPRLMYHMKEIIIKPLII